MANWGIIEAVFGKQMLKVDLLDETQNTPLHQNFGNDNPKFFDIIKKLLNSGADINAKNSYNNTPLHISAKLKPNVMEELLKWSPDIDTRNFDGDTPLTVAIRYCSACPDIVKCLLKAGADPNCENVLTTHLCNWLLRIVTLLLMLAKKNNSCFLFFIKIKQLQVK
ncbi:hypothetical protein TNIN_139431 [Trichonephila inaurata madagascariensis]|uniref:Alpha-latrotoxin n=1 Tax=Trichonephila inaurata madagascariensis TaxID=2747483 RepID=A0A8X6WZB4_9ARAC|nr:hypothetical protein TNIN_139431 [Trichonephila inaurata madagascariensis]